MVDEFIDDDGLDQDSNDIAIVGMACRFPGADNPRQYWENLQHGYESITELTDEELLSSGVSKEQIKNPNYVKSGMFLQHMEHFDAGFFGFSPMDAKIMDPQHRHFLECSWEALEDAAYDPAKFEGSVGVFGGSGHNAYMPYNLLTNPDLVEELGFFLVRHTGNDKDFLTTRVSYCLDLKGPSINVQTACSTSLVAVHTAAQSLLNGECDMALAGGVTIDMPHRRGYLFKDSEILSPDGHCRPFDASSKGTVFGSGAGVLVLRRLDDALAAGDNIHAVIKASAINNDGAGKVSYLAPSVDGQAAAIHEALEIGEIDPQSVEYIECHGTGTQLGDPIEVAALTQAYGAGHERKQYCAIGSVKSNIGHTDTAAGVASIIKVVQALKHRQMPPTLHYRAPNPSIDFSSSPFFVNAELRDWHSENSRRAGVSSLGVGGTNAHIIIEEAPVAESSGSTRNWQLLMMSARSDQALQRGTDRLSEFLDLAGIAAGDQCPVLADVAYTLAVGRRSFNKRRFAVVQSSKDALAVLDGSERGRLESADAPDTERELAFMFAGGGAQYAGMGAGLYTDEPVFTAAVDECLQLLQGAIDFDLKALLYPSAENTEAAGRELERPSRSLPALFVTQYSQARLWMSMGVEPQVLIGHSMGENTAACIAGVLSLKDALGLVALRGQLFETVPEGGMLSVQLEEEELQSLLSPELSVAAQNAPGLSVVSGPKKALAELENTLAAREFSYQRVRIDIAAHSSMLEPILQTFGDYLRSIKLSAPKIPFISNLTGDWIKDREASDPEYWVKHLRHTVRFGDGVGRLLEGDQYNLLEVGPGRTLSSLASMHPHKGSQHTIQSSLRHPDEAIDDVPFMLAALGRLWQGNSLFDSSGLYAQQRRRRVSIPTYAFDHVRHWVEPGKSLLAGGLQRRENVESWLYHPVWQRQPQLEVPADINESRVLLLAGRHPLNDMLVKSLRDRGATVVDVRIGDRLQINAAPLTVRAGNSDDYVHLIDSLQKEGQVIDRVIHALALELGSRSGCSLDSLDAQRPLVFDSLFYLAQAIGNEGWEHDQRWLLLTAGAAQVAGESMGSPLQALLAGPGRVIPHEFTTIECTSVDLSLEQAAGANIHLAETVVAQFGTAGDIGPVALRGTARFSQSYQNTTDGVSASTIGDAVVAPCPIRDQGVYLITGGTGGLGLVAAEALAQQSVIKLALLARRSLPERQYWPELIAQQAAEAPMLTRILALEERGVQVLLVQADVSDVASMEQAIGQIQQQLGVINGVIHTAGVIDDELIQLKDIDQVSRVLAPKVTGTLVLQQLLDLKALDFLLLYSSTSAFSGLPGQVDYAAANAFLDSFAHAAGSGNVISVNWPAWKDVGMAAAIADGSNQRYQPSGRPVEHPLLDRCIQEDEEQSVYSTLFDVEGYWLLSEHRIKEGGALIPGSGFVELARAAYAEARGPGAVEIKDLAFELPFFVADHEFKALRVSLFHRDGGADFTISSDSDGEWIEHVRGMICRCDFVSEQIDLQALQQSCLVGEQGFDDPDHHPYLDFGSRWAVLKKVSYGSEQACIDLELDEPYLGELDVMPLHPAVLDMATAGAQVIIPDYHAQDELYVPVGYGRLCFCGQLSPKMVSHVVYKPGDAGSHNHDIARFDIRVYDLEGAVVLKVDDFTLQRISDVTALKRAVNNTKGEASSGLQRTLELGIDVEEGGAALIRVLQQRSMPQTAVSVYDLAMLQKELLAPFTEPEATPTEVAHDPDCDPDIAEIEQALLDNEAIESVVVRSHLDEAGERRIISHFVPDYDHHITVSELRRFAKEVLVLEFVPQQFIELDEMPVDEKGEIDRQELKDPFAPEDTFVAPRTSTERVLAKIWQEALGIDRVGLDENFFDIGGHSLLSIRIIVKVDKKFGVRLDQATMVMQTLEQIANKIDENTGNVEAASESDGERQLSSIKEKEPKSIMNKLFGRK